MPQPDVIPASVPPVPPAMRPLWETMQGRAKSRWQSPAAGVCGSCGQPGPTITCVLPKTACMYGWIDVCSACQKLDRLYPPDDTPANRIAQLPPGSILDGRAQACWHCGDTSHFKYQGGSIVCPIALKTQRDRDSDRGASHPAVASGGAAATTPPPDPSPSTPAAAQQPPVQPPIAPAPPSTPAPPAGSSPAPLPTARPKTPPPPKRRDRDSDRGSKPSGAPPPAATLPNAQSSPVVDSTNPQIPTAASAASATAAGDTKSSGPVCEFCRHPLKGCIAKRDYDCDGCHMPFRKGTYIFWCDRPTQRRGLTSSCDYGICTSCKNDRSLEQPDQCILPTGLSAPSSVVQPRKRKQPPPCWKCSEVTRRKVPTADDWCDLCESSFAEGEKISYCRTCDWGVCDKCLPRAHAG
eukprot:gene1630-525_t